MGKLSAAPGRLQMYVDDPITVYLDSKSACELPADIMIAWWLTLGLPLSWAKGSFTPSVHRWIGTDFSTRVVDGAAAGVITVPAEFAQNLFDVLEPFAQARGHVSEAAVDQALGKAGRLMYLVPSVRPWVSALWGALAGSRAANRGQRRESPPGRHAAKRFAPAARWIRTLLRPPPSSSPLLPLEQLVVESMPAIDLQGPLLQIDASPWGGGMVLCQDGKAKEYAVIAWTPQDAKKLSTKIGSPDGQTSWEYLVVLLGLLIWGSEHRSTGIAILGDNLAALGGGSKP